ncbi:MAG: D-sedoheptulose 7-phosphate isomerase [Desulfobacterales bacterium]|nr:D-sedoheptulose 7-phosphate isomerase [Desulfobacterales bacterium]
MFDKTITDHNEAINSLFKIKDKIVNAGNLLSSAINNGKKILICGNGGSAADSQHFAAEIVGRFGKERRALPSIALTTDTSIITALTNDYSYEKVFERQVDALGNEGDVLIAISTSGNSDNIIKAVEIAKQKGIKTISLLGKDGGKQNNIADISIIVSSKITARVQEAHILILHLWAEIIESNL